MSTHLWHHTDFGRKLKEKAKVKLDHGKDALAEAEKSKDTKKIADAKKDIATARTMKQAARAIKEAGRVQIKKKEAKQEAKSPKKKVRFLSSMLDARCLVSLSPPPVPTPIFISPLCYDTHLLRHLSSCVQHTKNQK